MAWIRAAQLEISERYARGPWTAVDYAVLFFCYDLGSIADWPVDAVVVQTAHRQKCLLGSLRSAADLRAAEALTGTRASVVVSVCWEAEMRVRGAPRDWGAHFQESGVTHLQVPLDDLRIVYARSCGQFLECAQQCAETWRGMWRALCGIRDSCLKSGEDFNVLFHCFGGINRSPGALCAWLVLDGQCTVDEAVAALLEARPALCPWQSRDYVLLALNRLRAQKAS